MYLKKIMFIIFGTMLLVLSSCGEYELVIPEELSNSIYYYGEEFTGMDYVTNYTKEDILEKEEGYVIVDVKYISNKEDA